MSQDSSSSDFTQERALVRSAAVLLRHATAEVGLTLVEEFFTGGIWGKLILQNDSLRLECRTGCYPTSDAGTGSASAADTSSSGAASPSGSSTRPSAPSGE